MAKAIKLYEGDNGDQDFWESEDGLLLLKVKGEEWWVAYQNGLCVGGADNTLSARHLEQLGRLVSDKLSITLEFSKEKVWKDVGNPRMELRRAHV